MTITVEACYPGNNIWDANVFGSISDQFQGVGGEQCKSWIEAMPISHKIVAAFGVVAMAIGMVFTTLRSGGRGDRQTAQNTSTSRPQKRASGPPPNKPQANAPRKNSKTPTTDSEVE